MILGAVSLENNEDFFVSVGQVLFAFEEENAFINPETEAFDQAMLDNYLEVGNGSENSDRAIAEMFNIEWVEFESFPDVQKPKIPVNE